MTCRFERELASLATAAAIAAGCSGLPNSPEPEPTASVNQDVARGTVALTCAFPTVTAVTDQVGRCTATLVHPRLVLFAAHCGKVTQVDFGEKWNQVKVTPEKCDVNPAYNPDPNANDTKNDSGYCVLKDPVNLPITPILPRQCAKAVLQAGVQVMVTGFGRTTLTGGEGTKRYGWANLRNVDFQTSANVMEVGQPSVGCPGDSGGPGLVCLANGTWWSVCITSTLGNTRNVPDLCTDQNSFNEYNLSVNAAPWIEQATGIDITPCSDANGNWEAGPECKNVFSADVGVGSGSWTTNPWCQGTKAVDVPESCVGVGAADAGPIDAGRPTEAGSPSRDASRDDGASGDRSSPPADVLAESR